MKKWILFPTTSLSQPRGEGLPTLAILALEDGTVYQGRAYGAPIVRTGEVVFNTSLTGYQEVFTDPSYAGQIVVLTNPQIGNYGTSADDDEATHPYIEGLVVREWAETPSNWRSDRSADHFLSQAGIPVISEIDTRALVRKLRIGGVLRGALSSAGHSPDDLIAMARNSPSMAGLELATRVSTPEPYTWDKPLVPCSPSEHLNNAAPGTFHVVAFDFGVKRNILRCLASIGASVTVVPATTTAEEVLALNPDGVFLSNGPGDPEPLHFQAQQVQKLIGRKPIFGICLGHQIIGLALGGKTFKLKFGHRGINHPVLNTRTQKVEITVQNHGFCVDPDSINTNQIDLSHINLNDNTLEGLRHRSHPLFCVQYHPEAAAGPHDSRYLFEDFAQMMKEFKQ
jgi:carbamoyl-phosphate synthase small subunit